MRYLYPIKTVLQKDKRWIASCRDIPEALTDGSTLSEALSEMSEALGAALAGYALDARAIPVPSAAMPDEHLVPVPALLACKLILKERMQNQGINNSTLARMLGVTEGAVRRLLNPDHHSKLEGMVAALKCLGRNIIVEDYEFDHA